MTCPRCARDLLAIALDAQARGDTAAIAQPLREAITEWADPLEARHMSQELARWEKLGQPPDIRYWLGIAARRVDGELPVSTAVPNLPPTPCRSCPQS